MTTYTKQYSIKWLNLNFENQTIEVLYTVELLLDTGEKSRLKDLHLLLTGEEYNKFLGIPLTVEGKDSTLGEFLNYLSSTAARPLSSEFPVETNLIEKFGEKLNYLSNLEF